MLKFEIFKRRNMPANTIPEINEKFFFEFTYVIWALLKKDFKDTLLPFKSRKQFFRDLLGQLFSGCKNVVLGAICLCTAIALVFAAVTVPMFKRKITMSALFKTAGYALSSGALLVLRGSLQIAFWPLGILIRVPLRAIITFFKKRPYIENNLEELVNKAHAETVKENNEGPTPELAKDYAYIILEKFEKAEEEGQQTEIPKEEVKKLRKASARETIRFFKQKIDNHKAKRAEKAAQKKLFNESHHEPPKKESVSEQMQRPSKRLKK